MKKLFKVILIVLVCLIVLVFTGGFLVGNYFYNFALNPAGDRQQIFDADQNQLGVDDTAGTTSGYEDYVEAMQQFADTAQDLYLTAYDGLTLHAYLVRAEQPTDRWAILVHGYTGNGIQMAGSGLQFYGQGYNILMIDCRGHGLSEGDYIGMGWHDRLDIVDWAELLVSEHSADEIVLYGISMGGAAVMMASGEPLPAEVKAIVEDCGYTSVYEEFRYQLEGIFGLPAFPVMNFAGLVAQIRAGYSLKEANAVDQVSRSVTPILFIHGDSDTFVPSDMVYEVYEAATCDKELYVVTGAGHGASSWIDGEAYWQRVFGFVDRYLDSESAS